jgi:hypothetical protein
MFWWPHRWWWCYMAWEWNWSRCSNSLPWVNTSIRNNPSFCQERQGVPDCSDISDGTLYSMTENYILSVTQETGYISYLPPLLSVRNVVIYSHYLNVTCVTLITGAPVMLQLFTQCQVMIVPFSGWVPHFTSLLLLDIWYSTYCIVSAVLNLSIDLKLTDCLVKSHWHVQKN